MPKKWLALASLTACLLCVEHAQANEPLLYTVNAAQALPCDGYSLGFGATGTDASVSVIQRDNQAQNRLLGAIGTHPEYTTWCWTPSVGKPTYSAQTSPRLPRTGTP